jgi:D-beta-D-heptose 7-phosphate kinase/D-beta-D-heptose 1-phosphate adenosyltransferase
MAVIGNDSEGATVRHLLMEQGIVAHLLVDDDRCTTVKERILGQAAHRTAQQILRLDSEDVLPVIRHEEAILESLREVVSNVDAILVSDYSKGYCTPCLLTELLTTAQERQIPVLIDPAFGSDWSLYQGATLIKPNRREAATAAGHAIYSLTDAENAGAQLTRRFGIPAIAITLDQDGMLLYQATGSVESFCCKPREISDVTGAGDTAFAVLGVSMARGIPLRQAVQFATVAASLQVERQGAVTVSWDEIANADSKRSLTRKIVTVDWLAEHRRKLKETGRSVVLTNGCFDLLHVGHITCLTQAAARGDTLVVAINSDASVRRLKGETRPVVDEVSRATVLAALSCVDYVVIFDEDTPHSLLHRLRPDVLVKGGDYTSEQVVGREVVLAYGGLVEVAGKIPGVSTSALLAKSNLGNDRSSLGNDHSSERLPRPHDAVLSSTLTE